MASTADQTQIQAQAQAHAQSGLGPEPSSGAGSAAGTAFADGHIFQQLQERIDEDVKFQENLRDIVQQLEKQNKTTKAVLARAHSVKSTEYNTAILPQAWASIEHEKGLVQQLAAAASAQPYYRWNNVWSRHVQDSVFGIVYWAWLGGVAPAQSTVPGGMDDDVAMTASEAPSTSPSSPKIGTLLSLEQVGQILQVPVNAKEDVFHITIEEYLHSLISLVDELSRLARTVVILQDFGTPLRISAFVKDVQAGFMVLNLKNDSLRKRFDSIKYKVKEVEDVVYDLSLRKLLPPGA